VITGQWGEALCLIDALPNFQKGNYKCLPSRRRFLFLGNVGRQALRSERVFSTGNRAALILRSAARCSRSSSSVRQPKQEGRIIGPFLRAELPDGFVLLEHTGSFKRLRCVRGAG